MNAPRYLLLCAPIVLASCASEPETTAQPTTEPTPATEPDPVVVDTPEAVEPVVEEAPTSEWSAPFPHVRLSTDARTVEVDAYVSPLIHSGLDVKNYYLEQFLCIPNTKEHESLLVTDAKPSHLHAALLLLGLEPGRPVVWSASGQPNDAEGPSVRVRFRYEQDRETIEVHPRAWTRHETTGNAMPDFDWVFSGSTVRTARGREFYEADAAGTVIGLASFGGETLSWPSYVSDLEDTGDLVWLAKTEAMPAARTPVVVVLEPVR